jgi:hypothetical protein
MKETKSLEIANYWTSNDFLTESNKNCGTLVAFDWRDEYLTEINTNIDLSKAECENFKFDTLVDFLKKNNFTFVLGLRNVIYSEENPSPEWTDKLKKSLKSNEIEYDEYVVDEWPAPIPEFDIPDNIFILRYSYDEYSKIDQLAAYQNNFETFIKESDWKNYYKDKEFEERTRVIVLCNDVENLVLKDEFTKYPIEEF